MNSQTIMEKDAQYVAHTYGRFPIALVSGSGAHCTDADGKSYLDLTSGIGVNSLGFCDPGWVAAVAKQLGTLQHTSNLYYTTPCIEVAEALCKRTGAKKVFFANAGGEANEGAIKAARKYSFDKYGQGRSTIVTLVNSFHGRTVTTLAATGQTEFHNYFFPFTEGFVHAEPNNIHATLEALSKADVCAIMLEMVQGEGGVIPLDPSYVHAVADYCAEHDILLIVDEVQSGIGRTGTLFSYMQFGITPDIVTCAKGLAGGIPIGGVLFFEKTESVLGPGTHATTFGANPVSCAGAAYVLSRMDDAFLADVVKKGAHMAERFGKMKHVASVSGLGMMMGVEFDTLDTKAVLAKCREAGVLALTAKSKLRLLPPLSITMEELDQALDIVEGVLAAM